MLIVRYSGNFARCGFFASRASKRFFLRLNRFAGSLQCVKLSTEPQRLTVSHAKGADFPIIHHTFSEVLQESADKYSDRIFINSLEQGVQLTFAETLRKADRLAAGLLSLGLQKGDRVALSAPNCWEWLVAHFALARSGLITVAMNPLIVEEEVVHCLSLTKVAAVIAPDEHQGRRYHDMLAQIAPEILDAKPGSAKCAKLPYLRAAICLKGKTPAHAVGADELASSASESDIAALKNTQGDFSPEDAVLFQFSSGTTGKPKAVVISSISYANNGRFFYLGLPLDRKKEIVHCVQVPLFHAFGLMAVISAGVQMGAKLVIPATSYNPMATLKAFVAEKCHMICGTPTMYIDLHRQTENVGRPQHSADVACVGGAPMAPPLAKKILSVLNIKRIHDVYGLSESTAFCFQSTPADSFEQMCYTVGKATPNVEVKVVDKEGQIVPVNSPGELWARGYIVMKEYFGQPKVTAETITEDGWLKTGDQFILDEHGYGKVIGRFKDVIIRGGENITPTEIEDVLTTHPAVIDAQVIAVEDERLGEELCACLCLREPVTPKAIRDFCRGKIGSFKIPRYYYVLKEGETFPRTTSGKIQKRKLRDTCNGLLRNKKLLDTKTQSYDGGK